MEKQTEQTFEEVLGEVSENAAMASSPAWKRFCEFLRGWEQDAHKDMLGNKSREMAWDFQQRWMQREALIRGAIAWGDQAIKQRDEMIEQMKMELQNA